MRKFPSDPDHVLAKALCWGSFLSCTSALPLGLSFRRPQSISISEGRQTAIKSTPSSSVAQHNRGLFLLCGRAPLQVGRGSASLRESVPSGSAGCSEFSAGSSKPCWPMREQRGFGEWCRKFLKTMHGMSLLDAARG